MLEYAWSTTRPDGDVARDGLPTTIVLPPSAFGAGWSADASGGRVLSEPCTRVIAVFNDAEAARVTVRVAPDTGCAG